MTMIILSLKVWATRSGRLPGFAFLLLVSLAFPLPSWAQGIQSGLVLGIVKDPAGAVVPKAVVTLTNTSTAVSQSATTSSAGQYLFPNVPPGSYQIAITARGFRKYVQMLTVQVVRSTTVNAVLALGATSQTVTVTASPPLLQTGSGSLGTLITNRMIENLPLNGRNPMAFVYLTPGLVQVSNPSRISLGNTGLVAGSGQVAYNAINGSDRSASYFMLDGAGNDRGNQPGYQPTPDQTQEIDIMTNTYDAQYGRAAGAIFNVITKDGSNQFHGSLYEYVQTNALNAANWFYNAAGLTAAQKPQFRWNEFGGDIGGPIMHNRLFFFFNYEGIRALQPELGSFTVPTAAERQGDFSQTVVSGKPVQIFNPFTTRPDPNNPGQFIRDQFPNNTIPSKLLNPVGVNMINKFVPLPNLGTHTYIHGSPFTDTFNLYSGRADYQINARNRLFARYSITTLTDAQTIGLDELAPENDNYWNAGLGYTSNLTPNTVLELFGSKMWSTLLDYPSQTADLVAFGFSPAFVQQLNIPNAIPGISGPFTFYASNDRHDDEGPWSFNANLIQPRGHHLLKYGFQSEIYQSNYGNLGGNGNFTFNGMWTQGPNPFNNAFNVGSPLADFLLGTFSSGNINTPSSEAQTKRYYAAYIQDDFRATPKLTLNLGLRWDGWQEPTDRYNRLATSFAYYSPNPVQATAANNYALNPIPELSVEQFSGRILGGLGFATPSNRSVPGQWNNWAPRFGFAYSLNQKTVIRGGYGLFKSFDAWGIGSTGGFSSTTDAVASIDGVNPYNLINNPFPTGFAPATGSSQGLLTDVGGSISPPNPSLSPQTVVRWNFGVERQLTPNTMLEINYVGTTSYELSMGYGIKGDGTANTVGLHTISNQEFTTLGPTGRLNETVPNPFYGVVPPDTSLGSTKTISVENLLSNYPEYTSLNIPQTGGTGYYNSLQATLMKRWSNGFSILGSYTYGKNLMRRYLLNNADPAPVKMLAPYDAPHRISVAAVWELPFGPGHPWGWKNGVGGALIGGWQANTIWTYQSGFLPWLTTPLVQTGVNPAISGNQRTRFNWFNTAAYAPLPTWTLRTAPYTDPHLRDGPIDQIDFSLFKNMTLWENLKLQVRGEFYNLPNWVASFQGPDVNPRSPTFGQIFGQTDEPRVIQFALRLTF